MSEKRILDETTASVAASDDYLYIDGQTNGSRKITPENIVLNSTTAQLLAQHISDATQEVTDIQGDISDLQGDLADVKSDLGDLSELETTDKSSIVNAINEVAGGGSGSGLTADIKTALLQIAQKVAYIDEDGQDYYDDLYDALYAVTAISLSSNSISMQSIGATSQLTATTTPAGGSVTWSSSNTSVATVSSSGLVTSVAYGSATITATAGSVSATCSVTVAQATCTGISAVYTQSGTVYDTDSLDSLKTDLVVTASWSNGTTSTLADTDYTLSGTLAEGTSTVTVSYAGQTDTFDVIVSVSPYYKVITIDDLFDLGNYDQYGTGTIPYTQIKQNRASYPYFDIEISSAYSYTFEYEGTAQLGVPWYFSDVLTRIESQSAINGVKSDPGWQTSGYTFTPNKTNAVCMRITFDQTKSNLSTNGFTTLRITRTEV